MSNNRINQETLNNLSRFDETQLLDNIEDIDYLKSLLFDDLTVERRSLTQEHIKLFKKITAIKQQNHKADQSEFWSEAMALEKTLWHAGAVINDMLYSIYELLASNPDLGYEIGVDSDDDFDDDDEE